MARGKQNNMKLIKLPILYHTEETKTLDDIGVEYDDSECQVKDMFFYRIDAVTASWDKGKPVKDQTCIYVSGDTFTCNLPVERVLEIIAGKE